MFDLILKIIMGIGIPTIIIGCIHIGRKLQLLDTLQTTTDKIKHNIKIIADFLIEAPVKFDHTKLQEYSPLNLTEKGRKYLEDIGFIKIFDEHSQDFLNFIDSENPATKYDVEKGAIKSISVLSEKFYFHLLKIYLFQHPQENMRSISRIAGIYVRDKYLEKHPDIIQ
jgi:hypothetical protein